MTIKSISWHRLEALKWLCLVESCGLKVKTVGKLYVFVSANVCE